MSILLNQRKMYILVLLVNIFMLSLLFYIEYCFYYTSIQLRDTYIKWIADIGEQFNSVQNAR